MNRRNHPGPAHADADSLAHAFPKPSPLRAIRNQQSGIHSQRLARQGRHQEALPRFNARVFLHSSGVAKTIVEYERERPFLRRASPAWTSYPKGRREADCAVQDRKRSRRRHARRGRLLRRGMSDWPADPARQHQRLSTMRSQRSQSVMAESVLVKHQLLIVNRSRKRSPNLRPPERMIAGLCALFMRHRVRLIRSAIVFKPSRNRCLRTLIAALRNRRDLDVQSARLAQLQAELDIMKTELRRDR
jgi:hypothetical protein